VRGKIMFSRDPKKMQNIIQDMGYFFMHRFENIYLFSCLWCLFIHIEYILGRMQRFQIEKKGGQGSRIVDS
jgi:hypothetical protein